MIIGHGGNKKELAETLGCPVDDIIDMSSNLNPLGPPDTIETVICDNLAKIKSLPEPDAVTMRKGFARFHGLDKNEVIAGNGTTWFIYTIPVALGSQKVLIAGPTYSDYKDACLMHHIDFQHYAADADNDFEPDIDDISKMAELSDTVFICNPNNPTGNLLSKDKLTYLIRKHGSVLFIVDESYLPFAEQAKETSLVLNTADKNLIVLSSMSKIFRIPGLRTGFLSAPKDLVEKIMTYYQPWSINALAQAVINHIFNHSERIEPFYQKTRDYIRQEKSIFLKSLEKVRGIHLFDSAAYFILGRLSGKTDSDHFCKAIGQHKILIRDCSNFLGLSDQYVRFSLKEREINEKLSLLIKQVLSYV